MSEELTAKSGESTQVGKVEESRAIAEVQAKMILAKKFPRDEQFARQKILAECEREALAEAATYSFPRGDAEVKGPSIRLAEVIARHWGNFISGVMELDQTKEKSTVKAFAWDLETNTSDEKTFEVSHYRNTKKGGYWLTDPRDIYETVANQGSRRKRASILALIPGDVIDEAVAACEETLEKSIAPGDINKLRDSMLAAFQKLAEWITADDLAAKVGKDFDKLGKKDIVTLNHLYNAIKDGFVKADIAFGKASENVGTSKSDDDALNEINKVAGAGNE